MTKNSRRGMSLPELMISVTLFTMVGIFVSYVSLAVATQARDSLSQVPAEQHAFRGMEYIRRDLLPASNGSLVVSGDGTAIEFQHPAREKKSAIYFDAETKQLIFDPNITESNDQIAYGRNVSGTFEILPQARRVRVTVITEAYDKKRDKIQISYQDDLTIRN